MNPLLLAVLLLIGGLAIMYLSASAKHPGLVAVVWWIGLLVAVLGAILVLAPILSWVRAQLVTALGA